MIQHQERGQITQICASDRAPDECTSTLSIRNGMPIANEEVRYGHTSGVSIARTFLTTFRDTMLRAISGESLRTGMRDKKNMLMRFTMMGNVLVGDKWSNLYTVATRLLGKVGD